MNERVKECYLALRYIFPEWKANHALWATRKALFGMNLDKPTILFDFQVNLMLSNLVGL